MTGDQKKIVSSELSANEPTTREEVVALFQRREAAYEDLDAAALAALYADDCVVDSPTAGTHHGRQTVQKVFQGIFDAFPDIKVKSDRLVVDGDHVAQYLHIEGTDLGEFLGMPPTGKSFRFSGVFLYELSRGKIARERRIYDFTGLLVQIGALRTKPL